MYKDVIKKKNKWYFMHWSIPFFFLFLFVAIYSPKYGGEYDIGVMLSVVTFLFGFFISTSFSRLRERDTSLKLVMSHETGRITSLFLLTKSFGRKNLDEFKVLIDKYTRITLNYFDDYEFSREIFLEFYNFFDKVEAKNSEHEAKLSSIYYVLGELSNSREEIEYLTKPYLMQSMRIINYVLGFILIGLLYFYRSNYLTQILFVVISTIVLFILLIMEDYDDINFGEYIASVSNAEELFDLIGYDRYYPLELLPTIKLERGKRYRIGFWNPSKKDYHIEEYGYLDAKKLSAFLKT